MTDPNDELPMVWDPERGVFVFPTPSRPRLVGAARLTGHAFRPTPLRRRSRISLTGWFVMGYFTGLIAIGLALQFFLVHR